MSDSDNFDFSYTADGEKLMKALKEFDGAAVKIGFQTGLDMHTDEKGKQVDMCLIAAYNEFGSSTTPARPFLKNSLDLHQNEIRNFCGRMLKQFLKGKADAEKVLKNIGAYGVSVVQKEITEGTYAPNAPSTIKKKGSSHPLIDTGQMRQSIHYFVEKNDGSEGESDA